MEAYHAQRARLDALAPAHAQRIRLALVRQAETAVALLAQYPADSLLPAGLSLLVAALVKSDALVPALQRLYMDCGLAEARIAYESLTPATKALAPPGLVSSWGSRLKSFITTEGAAAVRGITNTTRKLIRGVLNESAAAGDSIAVASKKLRDKVAVLSRERSVNIARTELVSASNYGSLLGAQATGLNLEKFWIATPDGRTRPDHVAANSQGAPLQDGFFVVGGERCRYPGDPLLSARERCRCRCSIGYRQRLG